MSPILIPNDATHKNIADSIFFRQLNLGNIPVGICAPNVFDLSIRQFSHAMTVTTHGGVPPFLHTISSVRGSGTNKQMAWSYTGSNVASVQDMHSYRDVTKSERPRKPMSRYGFMFKTKISIPIFIFARNPEPACLGFSDLAPKSSHQDTDNTSRHGNQ